MIKIIISSIFILHVHFGSAQVLEDDGQDPPNTRSSNHRRPLDPVSTFLSGLGNLFLDIDNTFSRQTASKTNAKDRMKVQMYGRPRSGANYFNRIRENYRDVQRRLGESLGTLDIRMSSDLGSVNVQNQGSDSSVDLSLPFLPMKLAVNSNADLKASDNIKAVTDTTIIEPEQMPLFTSSLKLGNTEINMNSKLDPRESSELLKNVENQIKKALEDIRTTNGKINGAQIEDYIQEKKTENSFLDLKSELNVDSKEYSARSGKEIESSEPSQADDSAPEGRILGDILYSEAAFDTLAKRVMKDAKWAIDPNVFPSRFVEKLKQLSDKSTGNTGNADFKTKTPKKTKDEIVSKIPQKQDALKQDLKKRISLKPLSNDVETILIDEKISFIPNDNNLKFVIQESIHPKDSTILAFTPEGVPLKLRMGPEVINPLKFLHKALSSYGVSLNIPVGSYDDIEPVGREILQLGTGSGGTMTRALYIDLSDSFQLESLLRTLKRTKILEEMQREGADEERF